MAAGTSALGEAIGGRLGTAEGRRVRNMADAGDASLPAARQILNDAPAEYPTAMAVIIGPTGASRLRSIATTPNEGQGMIRSFFGGRSAGRPSRVAEASTPGRGAMRFSRRVSRRPRSCSMAR